MTGLIICSCLCKSLCCETETVIKSQYSQFLEIYYVSFFKCHALLFSVQKIHAFFFYVTLREVRYATVTIDNLNQIEWSLGKSDKLQ